MENFNPKNLTDLIYTIEQFNKMSNEHPYHFIHRVDAGFNEIVYIYSNGKYRIYLTTNRLQKITRVKTERYKYDLRSRTGKSLVEEVKVVSGMKPDNVWNISIYHTLNGEPVNHYYLRTKPGEEYNIVSYEDSRNNHWDNDMDMEFPFDDPYEVFKQVLVNIYDEVETKQYKDINQKEEVYLLRILHGDIQWVLNAQRAIPI